VDAELVVEGSESAALYVRSSYVILKGRAVSSTMVPLLLVLGVSNYDALSYEISNCDRESDDESESEGENENESVFVSVRTGLFEAANYTY